MIFRIWDFREAILQSSIMELKLRYRGTILGFFWSVLEPLAQLAVLYLVFSFLYSAREDFVIYLFSGLIMVHLFNRATSQAMNSLSTKKATITSLNVPNIIFPLTSVLTNIWMFGIEVGIFFIFVFAFSFNVSTTIFLLPLILGLLIVLTTGVSLLLTVIRCYLKDFQTIWGIATMSMIFITPVFWFVNDMPPLIAKIFLINPLALLMEMLHKIIIFGTLPTIYEYSYSIGVSFAILFVGYFLFKKTEKRLVELL